MNAEILVAGECRTVPIEDMTLAELELASIQGNKFAEEELRERRASL